MCTQGCIVNACQCPTGTSLVGESTCVPTEQCPSVSDTTELTANPTANPTRPAVVVPTASPTLAPTARFVCDPSSNGPGGRSSVVNCTCPGYCKGLPCRARPNDPTDITCQGSCPAEYIKAAGRCLNKVNCRASKISTGKLTGESCNCRNRNCHFCATTATTETCSRCRNGFFLLDGECVESCPSELTQKGASPFARRCLEPFTCKRGRIHDLGASGELALRPRTPYGCNCPTPSNSKADGGCFQCEFAAGENGANRCSVCRNNKYLHNGACLDSCAGTGLAEYAPGSYRRECRAEFVCDGGKDPSGNACRCPNRGGLRDYCDACRMEAGDKQSCVRCKPDSKRPFLVDGECRKSE